MTSALSSKVRTSVLLLSVASINCKRLKRSTSKAIASVRLKLLIASGFISLDKALNSVKLFVIVSVTSGSFLGLPWRHLLGFLLVLITDQYYHATPN